MQALTSLGKDAVLYVYPYESHTPRAVQNNLDMWARWVDWFDRHVKGTGAAGGEVAVVADAADGGATCRRRLRPGPALSRQRSSGRRSTASTSWTVVRSAPRLAGTSPSRRRTLPRWPSSV